MRKLAKTVTRKRPRTHPPPDPLVPVLGAVSTLPPLGERPDEVLHLLGRHDAHSEGGGPRDALVVLADCRWQHASAVAAMLVLAKNGLRKGRDVDPAHQKEALAAVSDRVYVGWVPYKLASTVVIDLLLESQHDPPPRAVATLEALRAELERLATLDRGDRLAALILDRTVRLQGFVRDSKSLILSPGGEC